MYHRTDEGLLLGKTKEFWCSRLNFSCSGDELRSINIDTDVAEMVWFENPRIISEINQLQGNRIQIENFSCLDNFEFVWFEEGNIQSDQEETIFANPWEKGLNDQVKEVLESNTNLLI